VITELADALWHRWLPNERFPPPVDLVQPVRIAATSDVIPDER
jgi:hypothetical protein